MTTYTDTKLLFAGKCVDAVQGYQIDVVNPESGTVIGKLSPAGPSIAARRRGCWRAAKELARAATTGCRP